MSIKYFMNDSPVKIEWQRDDEKNELQLVLNGVLEPTIIQLKKTSLSSGQIIGKHKDRIIGTAKDYQLGILKKRILADVYKIKYKYMED